MLGRAQLWTLAGDGGQGANGDGGGAGGRVPHQQARQAAGSAQVSCVGGPRVRKDATRCDHNAIYCAFNACGRGYLGASCDRSEVCVHDDIVGRSGYFCIFSRSIRNGDHNGSITRRIVENAPYLSYTLLIVLARAADVVQTQRMSIRSSAVFLALLATTLRHTVTSKTVDAACSSRANAASIAYIPPCRQTSCFRSVFPRCPALYQLVRLQTVQPVPVVCVWSLLPLLSMFFRNHRLSLLPFVIFQRREGRRGRAAGARAARTQALSRAEGVRTIIAIVIAIVIAGHLKS